MLLRVLMLYLRSSPRETRAGLHYQRPGDADMTPFRQVRAFESSTGRFRED